MSTRPRRPKEVLVRNVNLVWYPVALVPIVAVLVGALAGWLPTLLAPFAIFLLFFWIFSFGFAVYGKLKKPPKDLRQ